MATDLFVYGSLLFDDVFRAVTGRSAVCEPAVLPDHARYRVRGASYPAVVPETGAETNGVVYAALDADTMAALDRFEGDMYTRERVVVRLAAGQQRHVETYVFASHLHDLLERLPWDPAVEGRAARIEFGLGPDVPDSEEGQGPG